MTSAFSLGQRTKQCRDSWRRLDHLLDVVEDQQQVLSPQDCSQLLGQRPVAELGQVQRLGDRRQDELGIADRGQRDEDHPICEKALHANGNLLGEARLAHATRSGQRHQPNIISLQKVADRRDVSLAADQWRERNGERGS